MTHATGRKIGAALAAVAIGTLAFGSAASASARPAASPGWRQVWNEHYGAASNDSVYNAAVVSSKTNAWVLGSSNNDIFSKTPDIPVAVHWNGKRWGGYAMPKGVTGYVAGVSATSASDIWAVTQSSSYVLHWNGARWAVAAHLPHNGGEVTGITAISATDVWVFGGGGAVGGIGTWHYNGRTWLQQKGNAAGIEGASALSAKDIWAVGGQVNPYSALERFNGKTWQFVSAKALSGLTLRGVEAFSNANVWVATDNSADVGGLLRYNGATWSRVTLPWKLYPSLPLSDGPAGLSLYGYSSTDQQYLVHRSPGGVWSRSLLNAPGLIAAIPGTSALWAVGEKKTASGSNAVIWARGTV